ncbi:MAG TPA: hypothetical protein VGR57_06625 [Ktedonobacterales bacterium]|nr:hypothetical protein [Ktedonobacterales bacterium]
MEKAELLRDFAAAHEAVIAAATRAAERGAPAHEGWGPREVVAHLAGWEAMASVRIPAVVAGMPPLEFADEQQATVMNNAINATIVTLAGDQPLTTLCGILRRAYQGTIATITPLDEPHFQPGAYVYERTRSVIEHCQEHIATHLAAGA